MAPTSLLNGPTIMQGSTGSGLGSNWSACPTIAGSLRLWDVTCLTASFKSGSPTEAKFRTMKTPSVQVSSRVRISLPPHFSPISRSPSGMTRKYLIPLCWRYARPQKHAWMWRSRRDAFQFTTASTRQTPSRTITRSESG